MSKFMAEVWVHSDYGDDECYDMEIIAPSKAEAEKEVKKFLKRKRSALMNDYTIKEVA